MRRHCLMHLWPVAGSVWRLALGDMLARLPLFDGRVIVAVAESTGKNATVDRSVVLSAIPPRCETLFVENDPGLREVASWDLLWDALKPEPEGDAVFYCHGKGVRHYPQSQVHEWASLMYAVLLDHYPIVENLFSDFPIVGAFRKTGFGFGEQWGNWHYSGSFFWSILGDIQERRVKTPMHRVWHGVESWPGEAYEQAEAGCAFHSASVQNMELYEQKYWNSVIKQEWNQFLCHRATGASFPLGYSRRRAPVHWPK